MERPSYRLQAAMLIRYLLAIRFWFSRIPRSLSQFKRAWSQTNAHAYAMAFVQSVVPNWRLTQESDIGASKLVGMAIGVIVAVNMLPPVASTVIGVNTSAWTFTGKDGVIAMMYLIPLVYIAGVIVYIVRAVL